MAAGTTEDEGCFRWSEKGSTTARFTDALSWDHIQSLMFRDQFEIHLCTSSGHIELESLQFVGDIGLR